MIIPDELIPFVASLRKNYRRVEVARNSKEQGNLILTIKDHRKGGTYTQIIRSLLPPSWKVVKKYVDEGGFSFSPNVTLFIEKTAIPSMETTE